jgi:hypothetical protein
MHNQFSGAERKNTSERHSLFHRLFHSCGKKCPSAAELQADSLLPENLNVRISRDFAFCLIQQRRER